LTQFRYDPLGFTAHGMYNINQMPRKGRKQFLEEYYYG